MISKGRFDLVTRFTGSLVVNLVRRLFKGISSPNSYLGACHALSNSLVVLLSVLDLRCLRDWHRQRNLQCLHTVPPWRLDSEGPCIFSWIWA